MKGDRLVREPGGDKTEDLHLTRGEGGGIKSRELLVGPELAQEGRHDGGVKDDEAGENGANGGRDLRATRFLEEHRPGDITAGEKAFKLCRGGDKEHQWHRRQVNITGRRAIEVDDEYISAALHRGVLDNEDAGFESEHGLEAHPGRRVVGPDGDPDG